MCRFRNRAAALRTILLFIGSQLTGALAYHFLHVAAFERAPVNRLAREPFHREKDDPQLPWGAQRP